MKEIEEKKEEVETSGIKKNRGRKKEVKNW